MKQFVVRWVFSNTRWVIAVIVEILVGAFFLLLPDTTMDLLQIEPTQEAAALFRLYGVATLARGLTHHAWIRVPSPQVQRRGLTADCVLASATTAVLMHAFARGLMSGPWAVGCIALFAVEAISFLGGALTVGKARVQELQHAEREHRAA